MRLNFSHSTPEMIDEAVARLGRALQPSGYLGRVYAVSHPLPRVMRPSAATWRTYSRMQHLMVVFISLSGLKTSYLLKACAMFGAHDGVYWTLNRSR